MTRVIVDYSKLTPEILSLLVEKFPDGYDDTDVIRFKNIKNEIVEAVEVRDEDSIYLVKISTRLEDTMANFDEDDEDDADFGEDSIEIDEDMADDDDDDDDDKYDDD